MPGLVLVRRGVAALLATTVLWGSSFPFIKLVVVEIGEYRYVWLRSLVALLALLPYVVSVALRGGLHWRTVRGGLLAGIAYALGLWLQGWGTGLTTASNSAFITGLNVVFVHAYTALAVGAYTARLGLALVLSVAGLYLFTSPTGGLGVGDFLVLLGAIAWAAQVVLVDRYSSGDPLVFVFFEMTPSLVFIIPDLAGSQGFIVDPPIALMIVYLGLACSVAAFTLQVYGQRYVRAEVAALIFLLEPVFAAFFAHIMLGETLDPLQAVGAALILTAMAISSREAAKKPQ